jgi:hypothetical protein
LQGLVCTLLYKALRVFTTLYFSLHGFTPATQSCGGFLYPIPLQRETNHKQTKQLKHYEESKTTTKRVAEQQPLEHPQRRTTLAGADGQ